MLLKENNLFEAFDFRYFGPIDGHDVVYLTKVLNDLKDIPGPKLLHVITKKEKVLNMLNLTKLNIMLLVFLIKRQEKYTNVIAQLIKRQNFKMFLVKPYWNWQS